MVRMVEMVRMVDGQNGQDGRGINDTRLVRETDRSDGDRDAVLAFDYTDGGSDSVTLTLPQGPQGEPGTPGSANQIGLSADPEIRVVDRYYAANTYIITATQGEEFTDETVVVLNGTVLKDMDDFTRATTTITLTCSVNENDEVEVYPFQPITNVTTQEGSIVRRTVMGYQTALELGAPDGTVFSDLTIVEVNGTILLEGVDYTLTPSMITFSCTLNDGDEIRINPMQVLTVEQGVFPNPYDPTTNPTGYLQNDDFSVTGMGDSQTLILPDGTMFAGGGGGGGGTTVTAAESEPPRGSPRAETLVIGGVTYSAGGSHLDFNPTGLEGIGNAANLRVIRDNTIPPSHDGIIMPSSGDDTWTVVAIGTRLGFVSENTGYTADQFRNAVGEFGIIDTSTGALLQSGFNIFNPQSTGVLINTDPTASPNAQITTVINAFTGSIYNYLIENAGPYQLVENYMSNENILVVPLLSVDNFSPTGTETIDTGAIIFSGVADIDPEGADTFRAGFIPRDNTGVGGTTFDNVSALVGANRLREIQLVSRLAAEAENNIAIGNLSNVDTTTNAPTSGLYLGWNGTNWVPSRPGNLAWRSDASYSLGQVVTFNGCLWISLMAATTVGMNPEQAPTEWIDFSPLLNGYNEVNTGADTPASAGTRVMGTGGSSTGNPGTLQWNSGLNALTVQEAFGATEAGIAWRPVDLPDGTDYSVQLADGFIIGPLTFSNARYTSRTVSGFTFTGYRVDVTGDPAVTARLINNNNYRIFEGFVPAFQTDNPLNSEVGEVLTWQQDPTDTSQYYWRQSAVLSPTTRIPASQTEAGRRAGEVYFASNGIYINDGLDWRFISEANYVDPIASGSSGSRGDTRDEIE